VYALRPPNSRLNLTGKPAERLSYAGSVSLGVLRTPAGKPAASTTRRSSAVCVSRKLSANR
jgi:hypothetical protein